VGAQKTSKKEIPMISCTIQRGRRNGRLLFGFSVLAAAASTITVLTIIQAKAQDTPDDLRARRLTLALAVPGTDERGGDSAVGQSNAQTIAAPKLTLEPGSDSTAGESKDLQEINRKLSNPVSDVWALFTEFDLFFSGGNVNQGSEEVGGRMLFQPIMPLTLWGEGKDAWKLISRPTLPILFSQPVPTGFDQFTHLGGLGDLQLPTLIAPPTGKLIFGLGPDWLFPTATRSEFGRQQWGVGPSGVLGYVTKEFTVVVLPQYYFGIGGWGDKPSANYMSLLYAFIYHLPDGWDIGTNPTVSYDHTASSGNQWNVPVGLFVGKMVKIGKMPVKFQLGIEYSVVKENDFGQRAQIKFNIIPVIPSLIKHPLFGGE
jgi:hypothetical protein